MQSSSSSNRPFETVKPLAESMGIEPVMDERNAAGNFVNKFSKKELKARAVCLQTCWLQPCTCQHATDLACNCRK